MRDHPEQYLWTYKRFKRPGRTRSVPRMSIHPRYWPTWLALGILRCSSRCRFRCWSGSAGASAGLVLLPLGFVRIARRNLELCLPELPVAEREKILREHFRSLGVGIFETAISWWSSDARIRKLTRSKARSI